MTPLDLLLSQSDPVNAALLLLVWQRLRSRIDRLRRETAYNRRWLVRMTDTDDHSPVTDGGSEDESGSLSDFSP